MINNKTINGNDNVDKTDETSEGKTETNNNNEDVQNNVSPELDEEITEDHKDESSLNKEYSKSDKKHLDDIKKLKKN